MLNIASHCAVALDKTTNTEAISSVGGVKDYRINRISKNFWDMNTSITYSCPNT